MGWDSNPRDALHACRFSRPVPSTARPPIQPGFPASFETLSQSDCKFGTKRGTEKESPAPRPGTEAIGEGRLFGGGGHQPVEEADTGAGVRDGVGIDRHGDSGGWNALVRRFQN